MSDQPANSPDSTKVESAGTTSDSNVASTAASTEVKPTSSPDVEAELTLEDLNALLAEDVEFTESLGGIGSNEEMLHDYAEIFDIPQTLEEEFIYWRRSIGYREIVYKIFPPIVFISFFRRRARIKLHEWKASIIDFVLNFGPNALKFLKARMQSLKASIGVGLRTFKSYKTTKKLSAVGFVVLFVACGGLIHRALTKGFVPPAEELFVGSLQEWAQESYHYDPATETETFYDSTHSMQNMVILPKMVVNLKRSAGSGPNPMGAFDFYVEGTASEVVVEVKDREAEVRDLFQRSIEEMNFDQVATAEGKQLLTEKLRKEVNKILTKGKVRRVFLKTALIKP